MKKILAGMSALAMVFTFSTVYARGDGGAGTGGEEQGGAGAGGTKSAMGTSVMKASDLMDKKIKSQQGEELGTISDLAVDPQSGRIAFAVIQPSDAVDIGGDKLIPVPMTALSFSGEDVTINMNKQKLSKAPNFNEDNLNKVMTDRKQTEATYRYFGVQPYWQQ